MVRDDGVLRQGGARIGYKQDPALALFTIEQLADELMSRCAAAVVIAVTQDNQGSETTCYFEGNYATLIGLLEIQKSRMTKRMVDSLIEDDDDDEETVA